MSLWRAVSDFGFYQKIVAFSVGRVLGYIAVMMLVVMSLLLMQAYPGLRDMVLEVDQIADTLPPFRLENGVLEVEGSQPLYIVQNPEFVLVIDTLGGLGEEALNSYPTGIWADAHKMTIKTEGTYQTLRFADFPEAALDNDTIHTLVGWHRPLVALVLTAMLILGILAKMLGTVVLAVLALIPNQSLDRKLRFGQLWRISAFAVTAPTLLMALANLGKVNIPYGFFVYWGLALVYVWKALTAFTPPVAPEGGS